MWNNFNKNILATGCYDNKVRIFDINQDTPINILTSHTTNITNLTWSPILPDLLVSLSDKTIKIWETKLV
jgi:WD40 repeat protein